MPENEKNRCEISYFRYAIDDYGRIRNDATLKFYMHVDDVIIDLHTNFQTSIVSTGEDIRIRESRYSERFFDTFRSDIAKSDETHAKALDLSFPMVPTI